MDFSFLNPARWFRSEPGDALPDQPFDDGATDHEKIRSLVAMPVILPFIDNLQNVDETPAMRLAYRQMLRSPIVKSAFLQGIFTTGSLTPEVHPVSKTNKRDVEVADAFKWQLMRRLEGGLSDMVWNILMHGCMDGISVNEKIWTVQSEGRYKNKEVLRQLKPKDVDQDLYLWVDAYRNITSIQGLRYNSGERWDPRSFVIYRHMPLFGNPGGMSDFRSCYQDFWALDTVEKLRAMGAEKRAFPLVAAEYPQTSTQAKLQTALGQLRYSNWLAVPRDTKIQVLDLAGTSDEYFTSFRRDKVENIFQGIQFAFLQSITGGKGQYRGSAQVAQHTAALKVWWLAEKLKHIFNSEETGLVKEFTDRNYRGVSDYPFVTLSQRDPEMLLKLGQLYKCLHELGWQLPIEHMEEMFGVPYSQDKKDTLPTVIDLSQAMPGGKPGKKPKDQAERGKESEAFSDIKGMLKDMLSGELMRFRDEHRGYIADLRHETVPAPASPNVTVGGSTFNITMPPSPEIPPSVVNVNVPEQQKPDVKVDNHIVMSDQPAPVVNVTNQIPPQEPPNVTVNVPSQDPPVVNVNVPPRKPTEKTVAGRDPDGTPNRIIEREID